MCTGPRVLCWMPGATAAAGAVPPGGQGHEAGHSTGWQPCTWWLSEAHEWPSQNLPEPSAEASRLRVGESWGNSCTWCTVGRLGRKYLCSPASRRWRCVYARGSGKENSSHQLPCFRRTLNMLQNQYEQVCLLFVPALCK